MIEEEFATGDSIIHRLDPRVRVIVAGIFSVVTAVSDRFTALTAAILFSLFLILLARLELKKVFYRLLIVNGLIFLLWLFLPFSIEGKHIFSLGPFIATQEGIIYAGRITLKSNAIILALIALSGTMPVFTMGRAMRRLHIPAKIVYLLFYTYRYIHVFYLEYQRLLNASKIRGFQPGTNMHTYRTYAYLVGMMFVKSYDRSERVRSAMLCRGFRGKYYDLTEFAFKTSDRVILIIMLSAVSGIVFLQLIK